MTMCWQRHEMCAVDCSVRGHVPLLLDGRFAKTTWLKHRAKPWWLAHPCMPEGRQRWDDPFPLSSHSIVMTHCPLTTP